MTKPKGSGKGKSKSSKVETTKTTRKDSSRSIKGNVSKKSNKGGTNSGGPRKK